MCRGAPIGLTTGSSLVFVHLLLGLTVSCCHCQEDERVYAPPTKRPRGLDPTIDVSGEDTLPEGYGSVDHLYVPSRLL